MTPPCALSLIKTRPELVIKTTPMGDLFVPEEWGAIYAPGKIAQHRYMLWRMWDPTLPILIAIMLNPSVADHLKDDRTVARLRRRAMLREWAGKTPEAQKLGGLVVLNCFAFRATDPDDMKSAPDPIGPANDDAIDHALQDDVNPLLLAWGINATHKNRNEEVICLIRSRRRTASVLTLSDGGHPGHPLYLPGHLEPQPWTIPG